MKKIFFLVALASLSCAFTNCKSKKSATASSTSNLTPENNMTTQTPEKDTEYRLIVSFISKGAGPDGKKQPEFVKYIESHKKKPAYALVRWGREGEADYCFKLTELSATEQTEFITKVKEILNGSDLVFVNENQKCIHIR